MIEATPVQKRILQSLVDLEKKGGVPSQLIVTGKEWDEHIQELVEWGWVWIKQQRYYLLTETGRAALKGPVRSCNDCGVRPVWWRADHHCRQCSDKGGYIHLSRVDVDVDKVLEFFNGDVVKTETFLETTRYR